MERNQKNLFGKNSELWVGKADEFHSVCTNTVCARLAWDLTTALTADTEQQQSATQGDPFRSNVHPLHPGLEEQLSTAPVPQNTGQQVCPNFPKDIRRIGSQYHNDVLELCDAEDPQDPARVMSIEWSRSDFPGRIWAARFLPFPKIQMKLCFPLWALLWQWEGRSQQQLVEQTQLSGGVQVGWERWWDLFPPSQESQQGNTGFEQVPPPQNCPSNHSGLKKNNKTWRRKCAGLKKPRHLGFYPRKLSSDAVTACK